ncbi:hypothetical protein MTR67_031551 [Solanum verrucosum]|uniref:Reverse transcriptase Ty1/copia-type domain-containing protein n=1 Tax=Solanum verrucosum TaxID=315347 RepID=A0AAF0U2R4_SOLVR|nr:hypothetical protein MTR67_031551 [Solanum verrucosum]
MADTSVPPIDHNDPIFLQSTNTPRITLIALQLNGTENYTLWSRYMKIALLGKNKLGFVDGSCAKSSYTGVLLKRWERWHSRTPSTDRRWTHGPSYRSKLKHNSYPKTDVNYVAEDSPPQTTTHEVVQPIFSPEQYYQIQQMILKGSDVTTNVATATLAGPNSTKSSSVNVQMRDKFAARALSTVFIGYSATKKGYKLYDLHSKRPKSTPKWFNEYVVKFCIYPMFDYLSDDLISPEYATCLAAHTSEIEPKTYHEAVHDDRWVLAMKQEIVPLEENGTSDIVDLPLGKNVVGCKWVFKIKYKADVAKMVTVRSVLAVVASKHWNIYQMDVYNAFLQGDLVEEFYMQIPSGFLKGSHHKDLGFVQSHFDYSLFTLTVGSDVIVVLVYVDDLILTGSNLTLIQSTKSNRQKKFKMKDLGDLRFFLGLEFSRNVCGILLNQRKYALELVADLGQGGAKPASTSLDFNQRLTSYEFDVAT